MAELRFALLRHETPDPAARHFDLFLEMGDGLFALKVPLHPEPAWAAVFSAERQADHRRRYLDYEGEISGGRGHVALVDRGRMFGIISDVSEFEVELLGRVLAGRFRVRRRGAAGEQGYIVERL